MDIEQQVTSLELAKKLKEAGYPQDDAQWYWAKRNIDTEYHICHRDNLAVVDNYYAAPTVAEWGEKLPFGFYSFKFNDNDFRVWYDKANSPSYNEAKEADARAKMWLYLKGKHLI